MYVTQYMSIYVTHVVSMARKIKSKTSLKKAVQIVADKIKLENLSVLFTLKES